MPGPDGRINVAILAVPEVTASALFGMFDLFSSPGRDWRFIVDGTAGEQRMNPYIVARSDDAFAAANGIPVKPHFSFADAPSPDVVCIPDFFVNPGESVAGQYEDEATWLKATHNSGAILSSACSGAVLLGEAGLLDNREAAIHWGYVATLTNNYPGVKVRVDRSLVLSGEAQRIIMAGGGTSWQDLALYIIARLVGLQEAIEVAKVYMLQWHDLGQLPFASLTTLRQTSDAQITNCQQWAAMNYMTPAPVNEMMAMTGLTERSFVRRFTKATGMSPLQYIHALRIEEAKQMLEVSMQPIEAIAEEVGYEDASFFGKLFRRKTGLTPNQYRLRFGALRRALGDKADS